VPSQAHVESSATDPFADLPPGDAPEDGLFTVIVAELIEYNLE
jgi:hypothetical protein